MAAEKSVASHAASGLLTWSGAGTFHVAESLRDSENCDCCRSVSLGETDLRNEINGSLAWQEHKFWTRARNGFTCRTMRQGYDTNHPPDGFSFCGSETADFTRLVRQVQPAGRDGDPVKNGWCRQLAFGLFFTARCIQKDHQTTFPSLERTKRILQTDHIRRTADDQPIGRLGHRADPDRNTLRPCVATLSDILGKQ